MIHDKHNIPLAYFSACLVQYIHAAPPTSHDQFSYLHVRVQTHLCDVYVFYLSIIYIDLKTRLNETTKTSFKPKNAALLSDDDV